MAVSARTLHWRHRPRPREPEGRGGGGGDSATGRVPGEVALHQGRLQLQNGVGRRLG